ncbi:MAG: PKD domain-containing protein [Candidatus Firestonebacteria bacterium]|nr:PKD domain-containing protein [Candidatus Firestonebacteria bacterium]
MFKKSLNTFWMTAILILSLGFALACVPTPDDKKPPTVTLTANPTTGEEPLTVNFTANASDPDGSVTNYEWTFGDGKTNSGTTNTTSHIYDNEGTYSASVKVTDNDGKTASSNVTITVTAPKLQGTTWTIDGEFFDDYSGETIGYTETTTFNNNDTFDKTIDYDNGSSADLSGEFEISNNRLTLTYTQIGGNDVPKGSLVTEAPFKIYKKHLGYPSFHVDQSGSDGIGPIGEYSTDMEITTPVYSSNYKSKSNFAKIIHSYCKNKVNISATTGTTTVTTTMDFQLKDDGTYNFEQISKESGSTYSYSEKGTWENNSDDTITVTVTEMSDDEGTWKPNEPIVYTVPFIPAGNDTVLAGNEAVYDEK